MIERFTRTFRRFKIVAQCLLFDHDWDEGLNPWILPWEDPLQCSRCGKKMIVHSDPDEGWDDGYWDDEDDDWRMG